MVKDHTHDKPDFYNDLDKTYENIWDQLIIGKSKSKSELHQGYISTFNDSFPSVRTVVLRHVDKKNNTISFHTDIRSSKIDEIKKNNAVTMLFTIMAKRYKLKFQEKLKSIIKTIKQKWPGITQGHLARNVMLLKRRQEPRQMNQLQGTYQSMKTNCQTKIFYKTVITTLL